LGGGCSISGHTTVGDRARIAGMSGATRNIDYPALPIRDWHRISATLIKMTKPQDHSLLQNQKCL